MPLTKMYPFLIPIFVTLLTVVKSENILFNHRLENNTIVNIFANGANRKSSLPEPNRKEETEYCTSMFDPNSLGDDVGRSLNTQAFRMLYSETIGHPTQSVFSPFSIFMALNLLQPGTNGETLNQIQRFISYETDNIKRPKTQLEFYHELLGRLEVTPALSLANKVFIQGGFSLEPAFQNKLKQCFSTDEPVFEQIDFKMNPEKARQHVNKFVESKTNDMIKDLLPRGSITGLTRLILVNALHFKANWAFPFTTEQGSKTELRTFTNDKGKKKQVPFMTAPNFSNHSFYYYSDKTPGSHKGVEVLGIPYEHDFDMFLFKLSQETSKRMARADDRAGAMELFMPYVEKAVMRGLRGGEVAIPKFKISYELKLKGLLIEEGVKDAFDPSKADLSGISKEAAHLYVSGAFHKGYIEVQEKGTEAAAATAVVAGWLSMPPFRFVANEPFMFLIRERQTHAIIFLGFVTDPSRELKSSIIQESVEVKKND